MCMWVLFVVLNRHSSIMQSTVWRPLYGSKSQRLLSPWMCRWLHRTDQRWLPCKSSLVIQFCSLPSLLLSERRYCDARCHAVTLCVCLPSHLYHLLTARHISLCGEGKHRIQCSPAVSFSALSLPRFFEYIHIKSWFKSIDFLSDKSSD